MNSLAAERVMHELAITRLFDAPRARVFNAFVDSRQMMQWLGPHGYTMTYLKADVRVGGVWRGCMRSVTDGRELWHGGVYREIVPVERLAFTFAFDLGPETLVAIDFEDRGAKTLMRFRQGAFGTSQDAEGHRGGWESEFNRLAALVARH